MVSTLARHTWKDFVDMCALLECKRRREETLVAEWKLLSEGYTAGVGHIGMVRAFWAMLCFPAATNEA